MVRVNPGLELSPHFRLGEFVRGVTEIPNDVLEAIRRNVNLVLEPWREASGVPTRVTSGYRTLEQNRKAGGVQGSYHLRGLAADCQLIERGTFTDPETATVWWASWLAHHVLNRCHELILYDRRTEIAAGGEPLELAAAAELSDARRHRVWVHVAVAPGGATPKREFYVSPRARQYVAVRL